VLDVEHLLDPRVGQADLLQLHSAQSALTRSLQRLVPT
jgi:hypothetical protein